MMSHYVDKDDEFVGTVYRRVRDKSFLSKYNVDLKKR